MGLFVAGIVYPPGPGSGPLWVPVPIPSPQTQSPSPKLRSNRKRRSGNASVNARFHSLTASRPLSGSGRPAASKTMDRAFSFSKRLKSLLLKASITSLSLRTFSSVLVSITSSRIRALGIPAPLLGAVDLVPTIACQNVTRPQGPRKLSNFAFRLMETDAIEYALVGALQKGARTRGHLRSDDRHTDSRRQLVRAGLRCFADRTQAHIVDRSSILLSRPRALPLRRVRGTNAGDEDHDFRDPDTTFRIKFPQQFFRLGPGLPPRISVKSITKTPAPAGPPPEDPPHLPPRARPQPGHLLPGLPHPLQ